MTTRQDDDSSSRFILLSNQFIEDLLDLAEHLRPTKPGTAAMLVAHAERAAGLTIDFVSRWP